MDRVGERAAADVPDHTDDLDPRTIVVVSAALHAPADGASVRPVLALECPAHDRDQRGVQAVPVSEEAARCQRNVHRGEVAGRDEPAAGEISLSALLRRKVLERIVEPHIAVLERYPTHGT